MTGVAHVGRLRDVHPRHSLYVLMGEWFDMSCRKQTYTNVVRRFLSACISVFLSDLHFSMALKTSFFDQSVPASQPAGFFAKVAGVPGFQAPPPPPKKNKCTIMQ